MKSISIIFLTLAAMFAASPTSVEADYRSIVIGTCQFCHGKIYSYYQPAQYPGGAIGYAWVPAYHYDCVARARGGYVQPGYSNPRHPRSPYYPAHRDYDDRYERGPRSGSGYYYSR